MAGPPPISTPLYFTSNPCTYYNSHNNIKDEEKLTQARSTFKSIIKTKKHRAIVEKTRTK